MRATYSASSLGTHHIFFCQGLRSASASRRRTVSSESCPRGTPKTGQSGTPENRPVVSLQDVDGGVGDVVPRRGERLERRQEAAGAGAGSAGLDAPPHPKGDRS